MFVKRLLIALAAGLPLSVISVMPAQAASGKHGEPPLCVRCW